MNKKIASCFALVLFLNTIFSVKAFAEEMVISGNGAGTENTANITSTQNATVTQSNDAQITNAVNNNTNTGENTADNSSNGTTNIQTGDASSNISVNNSNINTNAAEINQCCSSETNLTISGNGEGSTNTITQINNLNATSSQNNSATITNNITVSENTGKNTANNNNGNVNIKTGNITSDVMVKNKDINNSFSSIVFGESKINILIKNNGANSISNIFADTSRVIANSSNNNAFILNSLWLDFNTGKNSANNNNGEVTILTGDILSRVSIINENINSNFLHVDCNDCEKKPDDGDHPTPTPTPPPPPQNGGDGCKSNCGGGSNPPSDANPASASTSGGQILPATGSYWTILLTLASLIAFFSGWYLRFRSGIAPGTN